MKTLIEFFGEKYLEIIADGIDKGLLNLALVLLALILGYIVLKLAHKVWRKYESLLLPCLIAWSSFVTWLHYFSHN